MTFVMNTGVKTIVESIDVPSAGGEAAAYLARPDQGSHPAVLLLPDAFGIRPQIRAMASRIASWGFVVLSPNLVYREHGLPLVPMMNLRDPDKAMSALRATFEMLVAVPIADTVADADAWFDWLAAQPFVAGEKVGVVGYCRGGRLALAVAQGLGDRVAAVGCFHTGIVSSDAPGVLPDVDEILAELLFGFADADPSAPADAQAALATKLDAAGVRYAMAIYPDAPHGYAMADTLRYQEAGAERHYTELEDLLARALA